MKKCLMCGKPTPGLKRSTCSKECRYALVSLRHREAGIKPPGFSTEADRIAASRRMTGANCPKFNGYRTTGGNGRYILVRPPANYPFPESVGVRGYIREHRMVMELHIGRPLTRSEVVHHINGDTKDNRIENLDLVSSQAEHIRGEFTDSPRMQLRWPLCSEGCGRQAKPYKGVAYAACSRCRRSAAYRSTGKPGARNWKGEVIS